MCCGRANLMNTGLGPSPPPMPRAMQAHNMPRAMQAHNMSKPNMQAKVMRDDATGSNVCSDQDTFNNAVYTALKDLDKEDMEKHKSWRTVHVVIWMVFFLWAVFLAMKVHNGPDKVEHLLFAMVFSPIYVLAYYLGMFTSQRTSLNR